MKEIKWIKISTDIFDDEKIKLIESLPDADALLIIWLKLLVFAGRENNGGVMVMNNTIPYTEEMLAAIFNRPLNTVKLALATFEKYGMIVIIDDIITIPKWEDHQSLDKLEKMRQQNRERQARYRAKQKAIVQGVTLSITSGNAVLTQETTEKDTEKDSKNSCCGSGSGEIGYTEIWNSLTSEEVDSLSEIFEDVSRLISLVDKSVRERRKKVDNPHNYICGYADKVGWPRKPEKDPLLMSD